MRLIDWLVVRATLPPYVRRRRLGWFADEACRSAADCGSSVFFFVHSSLKGLVRSLFYSCLGVGTQQGRTWK